MKVFALVRFHQYHGEFAKTQLFSSKMDAFVQMESEYLEELQSGWEVYEQDISSDSAFVDFNEPVIWWEIHEVELPGGANE